MKTIDVGKDFYHRLANRDKGQGDGNHNAVEFRNKYLQMLDTDSAWTNLDPAIVLDFTNVKKIGPSFANEAFAYYTQYANPEQILKKIVIKNASVVKHEIIHLELNTGYSR